MRVLAVDAGRTRCRVAVVDDDRPVAGPAVVDSGVTLADPDGAAGLAERIRQAVAALPPTWDQHRPEALVVAAAGGLTRPAQAARLAEQLTDLPTGQVLVTGDVVAAHAGAFDGAAGVVLAVGTGAVALGVAPDGRHRLVDGGGWLVGDDGSGFAVGRAGLAAALRHTDGRPGGSAELAQAAVTRFAPTPPPEPAAAVRAALAALHADPDPARVASFAPEVAAAARAGDPAAVEIWQQAVAQLTETVRAAGAVLPGPRPAVTVTGALSELEDLLVAPLRARLARHDWAVVAAAGVPDALVGAARLARARTGAYQSLLCARAAGVAVGGGRYPAGRRSAAVRAPAGSGSHARREHT